jgi:hypothetical protein
MRQHLAELHGDTVSVIPSQLDPSAEIRKAAKEHTRARFYGDDLGSGVVR